MIKLTPEQKEQMVTMFKKFKRYRDIAKKFDVNQQTVSIVINNKLTSREILQIKKQRSIEAMLKWAEKQRTRYHEDPEYRKKIKANSLKRHYQKYVSNQGNH